MVWKPRVRGENLYHHVYAWGNDRHPIFKEDSHFVKYLCLLANYSQKFSVSIIAYALMEHHVHLFLLDRDKNISEFMHSLHGDYAKYYNQINMRTGHVFGERYNNKIVQVDIYGKWLSRYIHRQALEAGIVSDPIEYEWTSYRAYIKIIKCNWLRPNVILDQFDNGMDAIKHYKDFVLDTGEDPIFWNKTKLVSKLDMICNQVCKELDIDSSVLHFPKGKHERIKRQEALRLLIGKYSVTRPQLAGFLKMPRNTLSYIMRGKKY